METPPEQSGSGRSIALAAAAGTAIAALFSFLPLFDTDVGWHVAVGRLILAGRFPRTNVLSWTAADQPWYPTSWLFDVLSAIASDALPGTLGLQLLTFAFLAAFAFLLARACALEDSPCGAWIVPAVMALLVPRIVPRPHVTAWAALAFALWLGPLGTRARAVGVGVVALAGNLHSGAAFAGGVLGLHCLEAFFRSRKRIELLLAVGCGIALLLNPTNPLVDTVSRDLQAAARILGVQLHVLHASTERDFDAVFTALVQLRAAALVIGSADPLFGSRAEQLGVLALRHAVPAIYQFREFAAAGGLMSYGGSLTDAFRQVGVYTGRILKGEKPADLPVQQSAKVELIVNLKTAKALGLTVPLALLGRADEVIE